MTDIVERLRASCSPFQGSIAHEAADEIERLRAENERLQRENLFWRQGDEKVSEQCDHS